MFKVVHCIVLASIAFATPLRCETDQETKSLRGIKSVNVTVGCDGPASALSIEAVKTDIELAFRQSGIAVVKNIGEVSTAATHATVTVSVDSFDDGNGAIVYVATISAVQIAVMARTGEPLALNTWNYHVFGTTANKSINEMRNGPLKDITSRFLNAYLSVNPKK
jgi:hypothetical protein